MSETEGQAGLRPGLVVEAFSQVPRAFWSGIEAKALHNMLTECGGRLTLPEREHLWKLLGHTGEPPRRVRLTVDHLRMVALGLGVEDEAAAGRLLDALREGRRGG